MHLMKHMTAGDMVLLAWSLTWPGAHVILGCDARLDTLTPRAVGSVGAGEMFGKTRFLTVVGQGCRRTYRPTGLTAWDPTSRKAKHCVRKSFRLLSLQPRRSSIIAVLLRKFCSNCALDGLLPLSHHKPAESGFASNSDN